MSFVSVLSVETKSLVAGSRLESAVAASQYEDKRPILHAMF